MTSSWSERKLGDLIQINPDALNKTYPYSEIEYLDISSVGTGYYTETCHLKLEEAPSRAKRLVSDGDTIISTVRPGNKSYCYLKKTTPRMVVSTGFAVLRAKKDLLDERFLYYLVSNPAFTEYLVAHEKGAAYPAVGTETIENAIVNIPDLPTQKKISDILGSLDDKIELNRRMNETLEQMAMAVYKHWFVDFGPFQDGEFVETELGMSIPNGWEICNFGDVSLNFNSRRIPLSNIQRQERKGSYPYYGAAGIIDFVDDYLYDGVFLLVGEDGSVMKDDGTPFLQYVEGKFWVNNHAHVIQGTNDVSTEWLMLHLKSTDISRYVTGAVQPKLSKGNLNSIPFVLPPTEIRKEFNNKIVSFFEQIRSNEKENKYLAETRDYLLPLLLSGEIELTEAQEQVEEVLANA
jgi:type I restriction enzyme S subunit